MTEFSRIEAAREWTERLNALRTEVLDFGGEDGGALMGEVMGMWNQARQVARGVGIDAEWLKWQVTAARYGVVEAFLHNPHLDEWRQLLWDGVVEIVKGDYLEREAMYRRISGADQLPFGREEDREGMIEQVLGDLEQIYAKASDPYLPMAMADRGWLQLVTRFGDENDLDRLWGVLGSMHDQDALRAQQAMGEVWARWVRNDDVESFNLHDVPGEYVTVYTQCMRALVGLGTGRMPVANVQGVVERLLGGGQAEVAREMLGVPWVETRLQVVAAEAVFAATDVPDGREPIEIDVNMGLLSALAANKELPREVREVAWRWFRRLRDTQLATAPERLGSGWEIAGVMALREEVRLAGVFMARIEEREAGTPIGEPDFVGYLLEIDNQAPDSGERLQQIRSTLEKLVGTERGEVWIRENLDQFLVDRLETAGEWLVKLEQEVERLKGLVKSYEPELALKVLDNPQVNGCEPGGRGGQTRSGREPSISTGSRPGRSFEGKVL